nr:putative ribonuclease H-like domain-containing protein [Tanacetum cinerariifolium]
VVVLGSVVVLTDSDPSMVILSIPRKHNLYTFSLNELAPKDPLTCLIAKASQNESTLWHRRLCHVNFRNMNKLVKGNLVRGLPSKGIRWDYSNERTPQQNGVAERKNQTLIEAAITMLADSLLPTIFWSEAVANAFYVLNRVLVTKPHRKTPYELLTGHKPSINVLIIQYTPTLVVPIVNEATAQNDDIKSDLAQLNADNLDELAEHQALQRQEQVGKEEADRLGLAFPSLNPMLGVGTSSISSSIYAGSTPSVSAGSTPQMSPCASPIFVDRHSSVAGKCHVPTVRPTCSAGRPVSASRPTGSAGRPISAGRPTGSASRPVSAGRPTGSAGRPSDIHDGLTIFDCPKSGIFTSSSYDEDFSGPDANNLESSLNVQEPTTMAQAFVDPDWVEAMQAEMQQFRNQKVGIVCRNKARLVAQGHRQEEGIDYTNFFAPVARIMAIRLFLAFASFIGFKVYQMDVKSAFLYGKIAEEVYVTQPRGFENPDHPKRVYKVVKALYGLHQALRAWYERLSSFLLKHRYRRGSIDQTLFIKKDFNDIMLVQVYVDDIIFGSTRKDWCEEFETLMQSEFEMSSIGPLTFFPGLQVDQRLDGIFIHQKKYVADILKKFDLNNFKLASTPFEPQKIKEKNVLDEPITYPKLGLCYPRDSPFDLKAFSDSDYVGAHEDRKSTTGGCQFLGRGLISWQCKKQTIVATSSCEAEYVAAAS